jgi:hypothetical protein
MWLSNGILGSNLKLFLPSLGLIKKQKRQKMLKIIKVPTIKKAAEEMKKVMIT